MSAYAEICSLFEARQKMEEAYRTAAYSQLLTFVELFEFYIDCETKDRVVPLRIDEKGLPLPDQTAPFRFEDNKLIGAACLYTEDKSDSILIPLSVKPVSLVECFLEIGYGTDDAKQFHVNFSYGAIGMKQSGSDNALSYLEALFRQKVASDAFRLEETPTESE